MKHTVLKICFERCRQCAHTQMYSDIFEIENIRKSSLSVGPKKFNFPPPSFKFHFTSFCISCWDSQQSSTSVLTFASAIQKLFCKLTFSLRCKLQLAACSRFFHFSFWSAVWAGWPFGNRKILSYLFFKVPQILKNILLNVNRERQG